MRKAVALVAVICVALAAPAAVGAGDTSRYRGAFELTGTMSFILKKSREGKFVFKYSWDDFPLLCESGPETSSSFLESRQKVENRRFSATAVDNPQNPGARLSLNGKLVGPRRAEGTLRIRGDRVPIDPEGDRKRTCESGRVAWTAKTV